MKKTCALLIALCLACAGEGRDVASAEGLAGPDVALEPRTTDVFTVGAFEGEDWEVFGEVASVAFDGRGNLYVLDRGANRVTVVDARGDLLRTVGQQGGGPGEFQAPLGFVVLPDGRIAVFDIGKQGFQLFDEAGAFVESVPVDLSEGGPGGEMYPLPDGRVVSANGIRLSFSDGPPDPADFVGGGSRPVDRFDLGGGHDVLYEAWDLPPAPVADERSLEGDGGNFTFTMRTRAYEPGLHVGVLSDGRVAVVDSTGYRVKLVDPTGSVSGVLERPIEPRTVTDALEEAERDRRIAALEDQGSARMVVVGGGGGMQIDQEQMREMMADQVRTMEFAEVVPVISALKVDSGDRLWIRRAGDTGEEEGPIDVVTADGEYLGTVAPGSFSLPDAFGPDGLVAYIEADELGVETVRVARLTPF